MEYGMMLVYDPLQPMWFTYLRECSALGVNVEMIQSVAERSIRYYKSSPDGRVPLREQQDLEWRWYRSLVMGKPDYGVYADDFYLADLWACWVCYSREYIRKFFNERSMAHGSIAGVVGPVRTIVDLGCGVGITTAAWAEMYPEATVTGTNFPDLKQTIIASSIGRQYGFKVRPDCLTGCGSKVDLVFASEYFEHIPRPIQHATEIVEAIHPRVLFVANAFGAKSIGHFPRYEVGGKMVVGKIVGRHFNGNMRRLGYEKVKTKLWNDRPSLWIRRSGQR